MISHDGRHSDPLDERAITRRDQKGRFRKGSSGNPHGKPLQVKPDPKLPASRRRVVSSVADEEVEVKVNGKTAKMTMFEANVRALAHAGIKDRIAAQRFIDLATETSERDLQRRLAGHAISEYYGRIEEENERLRKQLSPQSGTLVVPWDRPLDEWSPQAFIDDEKRVRLAMKSDHDDRGANGDAENAD